MRSILITCLFLVGVAYAAMPTKSYNQYNRASSYGFHTQATRVAAVDTDAGGTDIVIGVAPFDRCIIRAVIVVPDTGLTWSSSNKYEWEISYYDLSGTSATVIDTSSIDNGTTLTARQPYTVYEATSGSFNMLDAGDVVSMERIKTGSGEARGPSLWLVIFERE